MKFVKASEVKFIRPSNSSTPSSSGASSSGKKPKKKMTFVKASDEYESTNIKDKQMDAGGPSQPMTELGKGIQKYGLGFKGGNVKQAMHQLNQERQAQQQDEFVGKFHQLANNLREFAGTKKNAVELVHMAAQKLQMQPTVDFKSQGGSGFLCEMLIDCVFVSLGSGTSKKSAKADAFEKSVHVLCKPYLNVNRSDPKCAVLESSDEPFGTQQPSLRQSKLSGKTFDMGMTKLGQATQSNITPLGKGKKRKAPSFQQNAPSFQQNVQNIDLSEVIIMEPAYFEATATSTLHQTMAINRIPIEYEFDEGYNDEFTCSVIVAGSSLAEMSAMGKNDAKQQAAEMALSILKEMCWTIKIKGKYEAGDDSVSKDELLGDVQKSMEAIPSSNIGNQLLKKMGWVGGGVGKTGQGIAEPVKVEAVINRSGLGLQAEQGISKDFLPQIKTMLQDYATSNNYSDMTFSPEFRKEERAIIHKEAQKLGLKSHSHGTGEDRFLVISRRMTIYETLQHILDCGGETPKYKVEPPGSMATNG